MVSHSQISEELARYLNGKTDLDSFEDWIVVNTWNIHLSQDSKAESLAFAIEESLAEHSSGHISEAQLKQELKSLLLSPELPHILEFDQFFVGDQPSQSVKSSSNGSVIFVKEIGARLKGIRPDRPAAVV